MNYTAPDGYTITSNPNGPITYTCPITDAIEGTFSSVETYSAPTSIGIQQIQITRIITSGNITIIIKESTSEELIQYQKDAEGVTSQDEIINNLLNP
jgi:hypothetical protein